MGLSVMAGCLRVSWARSVLVRLEEAGLKKNLAADPFADDLYDLVDANGDGTGGTSYVANPLTHAFTRLGRQAPSTKGSCCRACR